MPEAGEKGKRKMEKADCRGQILLSLLLFRFSATQPRSLPSRASPELLTDWREALDPFGEGTSGGGR